MNVMPQKPNISANIRHTGLQACLQENIGVGWGGGGGLQICTASTDSTVYPAHTHTYTLYSTEFKKQLICCGGE
jgi:hypothetical protein